MQTEFYNYTIYNNIQFYVNMSICWIKKKDTTLLSVFRRKQHFNKKTLDKTLFSAIESSILL